MMDKQSAINLIRETFEKPFEKERFVYFAKNLFNRISPEPFEYSGQFIPDTFKPYLSKYERIGKYTTEDKRIDILIVYLNKETSIERARTMQRNFVAGYLMGKYGSPIEKDAAVVAFVSPGLEDWRFSLVKMEYKLTQTKTGRPKAEEEFTPAKRYSFLVGKNEPNHTAQQQLLPILMVANNPTLDQIEMAFSVEKVAKEFLNKYLKLYLRLKGSMDRIVEKDKNIKEEFEKKKVSIVDFSKKLLGQIVFLYFLQKKGWLGVPKDKKWGDGDRNFLRSLFKVTQSSRLSNKNHKQDACDTANFFNDYLKFLFYDTLNNPRTDEADPSYSKDFDCRIPFLNGGLFEPNYAWKQTDIIIPNGLFSNQEKTKEGDIGSGILDVFDCFNFTVCEDEPLEKEVALDPELLGKVFENLIEENLRKGQGAYYTPREIVHYMCQESLINYLGTELEDKITKADIELFIKYGEHIIENEETALRKEKDIKSGKQKSTTIKSKMPESIKNNAKLIDDKLANIRVCDPAVGSGAFPVGMMLEIVKARNVLTNYIVTQPSWLSDNEHKQDACDTVTQPSWLSDNIYFASDEPISIKSRNLPHWEQGDKAYFVTFRLYDSIPKDVAENIRQERENWLKENRIENTSDLCKLDKNTQIEYYRLFSKRYDELLDNNYGSCVLANSDCKQIVESALMHFNNERYYLDKYVIMPNHVHVIVIPKEGWILSQIMHSWKSYTANKINKLLCKEGELWMHESFDHIIRSPKQFERIRKYIENNPKVTHASSVSNTVTQPSWLSNEKHKQDACDTERTPYNFKRHCIENCLYGVDIDSSAIDIAKLRFWLSLVVDEEDITKIKPLPNLDYKLVCGNSLLKVERDLFNAELFNQLEELKPKYFNETDTNKKLELKKQIDKLIKELVTQPSRLTNNEHKQDACDTIFDFEVYFSEVFHEKKGFDVVIGNPPYVKEHTFRNAFDGLRESPYYKGKMDIWYLFACKGIDLLKKETGILTFIAQNNWVTSYGASIMRNKVIQDTQIIQMLDFGSYMIFESSDIQTMIMIFRVDPRSDNYKFDYRRLEGNNLNLNDMLDLLNCNQNSKTIYLKPTIQRNKLVDKFLTFSDTKIEAILDKLSEEGNFRLMENEVAKGIHYDQDRVNKNMQKILENRFNIGEGIFALSNKEKNDIPFTEKELELIKPSYTTKELGRYYANRKNSEWVIYKVKK